MFELTDDQRELLRKLGSVLATRLAQYFESDAVSAAHHLDAAAFEAETYGRISASRSLSLSQTIHEFLRLRTAIQRDIALAALRRGLNAANVQDELRSSDVAMDRIVASISVGYRS